MAMKLCFVTTGATAPFTALIESILSQASLNELIKCKVTHVFIQYGTAKDVYEASAKAARDYLKQDGKEGQLEIDGMDFDSGGLQKQFKLVRETNGLAISHAGKLPICSPCLVLYKQALFPLSKTCDINLELYLLI
jgi:beta-1,4-N-acetylglucosaminyltransferase